MTDTSNWVSVHGETYAECTVDRIFEELKQVVERDVGAANELPAEQRRNWGFRFKTKSEGTFTVEKFKDDGMATMPPGAEVPAAGSVDFLIDRREANGPWILVKGYETSFTVTPKPEPESRKCGFRVGDDILLFEASEVSKIALTPLFFDRDYLL